MLKKIYKTFIYILPAVLFFSYYPLIHFGSSESMNFEISLPIVWLVLFDLFSIYLLFKHKKFGELKKLWPWLLLPIYLTISIFWSLNFIRGFLTVGILWLIYLAIFSFYSFKHILGEKTVKENLLKSLFYSSLVICLWCFVQCILDLAGVSREYTLMCAGCTYQMFGFPHPNGFAIEPQFMGNLLLAPTIIAGWFMVRSKPRRTAILFFIFSVSLFLTFSRGAIYAFTLAAVFLTILQIVKTGKWRALLMWPIIILAFLFTLNLQGLMSEFSKTDDTYGDGINKVINHLSLGVIDFSQDEEIQVPATNAPKEEAIYDGYVAESTDTRLRLSGAAVQVWRQSWQNILFGVGLGGAGQALYINGLSPAPKEITQNQYASILLESGLIGAALFVLTLVLLFKSVIKSDMWAPILSLLVAYGITLVFFSGLPNALHIYLLPIIFLYGKN